MTRLVPLTALAAAVAALGACSTPQPTGNVGSRAPDSIVTNVQPYKAGNGVVQRVFPQPMGAAAGSSAEPMQRLEIKMSDGSIQYVDTPSREFTRGTRVTLTADRKISKT